MRQTPFCSATIYSPHFAGAPPGLERWKGPRCSELVLRYTILGGSHIGFSKVGRVRTRATRAMAAPMPFWYVDQRLNGSRPTFNMLPGWAIARPGLHFAHPGNVERPTQTRGYFCIMNHNRHREPELQLCRSRPFVQKFFRDKATF